jgi:hypothetical protein
MEEEKVRDIENIPKEDPEPQPDVPSEIEDVKQENENETPDDLPKSGDAPIEEGNVVALDDSDAAEEIAVEQPEGIIAETEGSDIPVEAKPETNSAPNNNAEEDFELVPSLEFELPVPECPSIAIDYRVIQQQNNVNEGEYRGEIILGDDTIPHVSTMTRLLESPQPSATFEFLNVDDEADNDELVLDAGLVLTRSGSLESLPEDPRVILFSSIDREREVPRPVSPTQTVAKQSIELENTKLDSGDSENPQAAAAPIQEGGNELGSTTEQKVEVPLEINRQELIEKICRDLETKERLTSRNVLLQAKLSDHFRKKKIEESKETEKTATDQEQRYANCMGSLDSLKEESELVDTSNRKVIEEYKQKLQEKLADIQEKSEEFWKHKRSIALESENSRTGKTLPENLVNTLENTERKKEQEVIAVRLENIKLRNKLKRHEQLLKQKEELADGLHLIDFEQLKIENQTYNEKIEERNEAIPSLTLGIVEIEKENHQCGSGPDPC